MTLTRLITDPASTGTWNLVPERSSFTFSNKTLWGLVPVNGRFTEVTGQGRISEDGQLSGRIQIRVASVKTGVGKRDEHLRSADFFDADNFPEITIDVTGIAADGSLTATMRLRGIELPLPLTVSATTQGEGIVAVTARTKVDRTRWGIDGNMAGMIPTTTTLTADAVFTRA